MNEPNLSTEARRRLWQCYSLLLRLADKAEKNTAADSGLDKGHESAAATRANELTRLPNDTSQANFGQMEADKQSRREQVMPVRR